MLMDNAGTSGSAPHKNGEFFDAKAVASGGEGDRFAEFVESREDLKPKMEMPAELVDNDNSAEVAGEMQPSEQTAPAASPTQATPVDDEEKKDEELKEALSQIKVARDAESLPKSYEKAVNNIVHRNRKNPSRMVREMDIARWALMEKIFNRKMGDGLNGGGDN